MRRAAPGLLALMLALLLDVLLTWPLAAAGAPVRDVELAALDGGAPVRLSFYTGRPLLLNFWAADCAPCVRELPLLQSQAGRRRRVQFLGVAVGDRLQALGFARRHGYGAGYPQFAAPAAPAESAALMTRFGNTLGALPYTVVLDPAQRPCARRMGELDVAWLAAALAACAGTR